MTHLYLEMLLTQKKLRLYYLLWIHRLEYWIHCYHEEACFAAVMCSLIVIYSVVMLGRLP